MATMQRFVIAILTFIVSTAFASITCVKVGSTATAKWVDGSGRSCSWAGIVGSNFGVNVANDGTYDCNGRCGAGCAGTGVGNVYTQDCFSHDICSYFNNAFGGSKDPNCGAAFEAAMDDTVLGYVRGCSQTNPDVAAEAPATTPVCL